jgi:mycothiol synthase
MSTLYTNRPYSHPDDLPAMLDLIRSRPTAYFLDFPSLAEIRELVGIPDIRETTQIWFDPEGNLAGFAMLNRGDTYCSLCFENNHQVSENNPGALIIAWAKETFRIRYHGKAKTIYMSVNTNNTARIHLLEQNGFTPREVTTLVLERDLSVERISPPDVPQGFVIRSLLPGEEPAWVDLHRAAFGTLNMTLDSRRSMSQSTDYDPELDLVATTADGRLAAYVFGSISMEENNLTGLKIGYTDPVGTHPDFQHRGLCRALLLDCLYRLRERGMEVARMGTGSWNTALQHAAFSVGYQVKQEILLYEINMEHEPEMNIGSVPIPKQENQ